MKHTLTALLQDRPGALNRTVSLFRRRGFNIESLSVAPSETPGLSRVTIVVDAPNIDRVVKQFTRLIEVVDVNETVSQSAVERETALVKVQPRDITAAELAALSAAAGARVVDGTESAMIFEITDTPDTVATFIDGLRGLGLVAVTRSGRVVMPRGAVPLTVPTTPVPFTSQADGASDDVAA
jgi:acetolactate synthase-1/3 small subunit